MQRPCQGFCHCCPVKAPCAGESVHPDPVTHKLKCEDYGKTELKAALTIQAMCLGTMVATISHFAFKMEPQGISLLRIREHRVEQARGRNDIMAQLNQLRNIFILKKFFNLITSALTFFCVLNGRFF